MQGDPENSENGLGDRLPGEMADWNPYPFNHPIETGYNFKPDPKSAIAPSCPIFQHLH
ncbi:hypothetical protein [Laspinema olomoucense]|uniref:Uncharacterized protein n=1 Tax=Laspinema olomoucense D3b TaxID=2953688 RepID=A0ABT2N9V5_9CYAN|nr:MULTISPECIES: hypothetical protein [unclassified Laspinema]MCT7971413.1 hypothetical protein [Laspinema sp. D3d]MCT7979480.1 hypothetical protein [Laspinema sp. D3b]MCT7992150.1 hypothetical protein [Laspinema sp. D3c]